MQNHIRQSGTIQQREPIDTFTGFLQCDVKLGDKVGFAVSVDGLIDIGPHRSAGTQQLSGDRRVFFGLGKRLIKQDDLCCKIQRFL